jgi:hypothetical protein
MVDEVPDLLHLHHACRGTTRQVVWEEVLSQI